MVSDRTKRRLTNTHQDFEFRIRVRSQVQYRISSFDLRAIITYSATAHPTIIITTTTIRNESTAQLSCHHKAAVRTDYHIIQTSSRKGGEGATNLEVAKLQIFDGISLKFSGFVTACKLYEKARMRRVSVEKQIQWMLLYV